MDYTKNAVGDQLELKLNGKFTFADHEEFRGIVGFIKSGDISSLVLDLSKIEFIDSAALGMLLIAREEGEKNNVEVILQNPVGQIDKMLKVSKFDSLFTIKSA